jgi:hypothetical protein
MKDWRIKRMKHQHEMKNSRGAVAETHTAMTSEAGKEKEDG